MRHLLLGLCLVASAYAQQNIFKLGSSYKAHVYCTGAFVQDRNDKNIEHELSYVNAILANLPVYQNKKQNSVKVAFMKEAKYFPGMGCVTGHDKKVDDLSFPALDKVERQDFWQQNADEATTAKLEAAVKEFTSEDEPQKANGHTRALLVSQNGKLVYEKYFREFNADQPQIGWSLTKSFTATMVGVAVAQGVFALDDDNLLPEWQGTPREKITLKNLLEMKSGLNWVEDYADLGSDVITMLFDKGNAGAFSAGVDLETGKEPGSVYKYSTGTSVVLQYVLKTKLADVGTYLNFPRKNLFAPLGISSAEFTADENGTYLGGSSLYMTPRDWLKLGELYLNKGQWQGQQVLDPSWVEYATTSHTEDVDKNGEEFSYGAHFETNKGQKTWKDLPESTYAAHGHQGQYIVVVPELNLVVTRLGLTVKPAKFDINALVAKVIESLK